jgi:hypothetical protein
MTRHINGNGGVSRRAQSASVSPPAGWHTSRVARWPRIRAMSACRPCHTSRLGDLCVPVRAPSPTHAEPPTRRRVAVRVPAGLALNELERRCLAPVSPKVARPPSTHAGHTSRRADLCGTACTHPGATCVPPSRRSGRGLLGGADGGVRGKTPHSESGATLRLELRGFGEGGGCGGGGVFVAFAGPDHDGADHD